MLTFTIALFFGCAALFSAGVIAHCMTRGARLAVAIQAELGEIDRAWQPAEADYFPSIVPPIARLEEYRKASPTPRSVRFNLPAAQLAA